MIRRCRRWARRRWNERLARREAENAYCAWADEWLLRRGPNGG